MTDDGAGGALDVASIETRAKIYGIGANLPDTLALIAMVRRLTAEVDRCNRATTEARQVAGALRVELEAEVRERLEVEIRIAKLTAERNEWRYMAQQAASPKPVSADRQAIVDAVEEWVNRARGGDASVNDISAAVLEAAVTAGWIAEPSP